MLTKLTGGKIYDPENGIDGEVRDIFIENGRIVLPSPNARVAHEYPLHGPSRDGRRHRSAHAHRRR